MQLNLHLNLTWWALQWTAKLWILQNILLNTTHFHIQHSKLVLFTLTLLGLPHGFNLKLPSAVACHGQWDFRDWVRMTYCGGIGCCSSCGDLLPCFVQSRWLYLLSPAVVKCANSCARERILMSECPVRCTLCTGVIDWGSPSNADTRTNTQRFSSNQSPAQSLTLRGWWRTSDMLLYWRGKRMSHDVTL